MSVSVYGKAVCANYFIYVYIFFVYIRLTSIVNICCCSLASWLFKLYIVNVKQINFFDISRILSGKYVCMVRITRTQFSLVHRISAFRFGPFYDILFPFSKINMENLFRILAENLVIFRVKRIKLNARYVLVLSLFFLLLLLYLFNQILSTLFRLNSNRLLSNFSHFICSWRRILCFFFLNALFCIKYWRQLLFKFSKPKCIILFVLLHSTFNFEGENSNDLQITEHVVFYYCVIFSIELLVLHMKFACNSRTNHIPRCNLWSVLYNNRRLFYHRNASCNIKFVRKAKNISKNKP